MPSLCYERNTDKENLCAFLIKYCQVFSDFQKLKIV